MNDFANLCEMVNVVSELLKINGGMLCIFFLIDFVHFVVVILFSNKNDCFIFCHRCSNVGKVDFTSIVAKPTDRYERSHF